MIFVVKDMATMWHVLMYWWLYLKLVIWFNSMPYQRNTRIVATSYWPSDFMSSLDLGQIWSRICLGFLIDTKQLSWRQRLRTHVGIHEESLNRKKCHINNSILNSAFCMLLSLNTNQTWRYKMLVTEKMWLSLWLWKFDALNLCFFEKVAVKLQTMKCHLINDIFIEMWYQFLLRNQWIGKPINWIHNVCIMLSATLLERICMYIHIYIYIYMYHLSFCHQTSTNSMHK